MVHFTIAGPSGPPQDLFLNAISPSSLSVTWRGPPRNEHNGRIRYYNISLLEVATGEFSWHNTTDSSTNWIISSLHPYYSYRLEVAAVTVGLGPFSSSEVVRMPESGMFSYSFSLMLYFSLLQLLLLLQKTLQLLILVPHLLSLCGILQMTLFTMAIYDIMLLI